MDHHQYYQQTELQAKHKTAYHNVKTQQGHKLHKGNCKSKVSK